MQKNKDHEGGQKIVPKMKQHEDGLIIWNNILKHILCPFIRQLVGIDKLHFNLMSSWGKPDTKKFICLGEKINSVFFCLFTNFPFFSFSLSLLFSHSLCLLPHLSVYVSTFTQYFVYHLFFCACLCIFLPLIRKSKQISSSNVNKQDPLKLANFQNDSYFCFMEHTFLFEVKIDHLFKKSLGSIYRLL